MDQVADREVTEPAEHRGAIDRVDVSENGGGTWFTGLGTVDRPARPGEVLRHLDAAVGPEAE